MTEQFPRTNDSGGRGFTRVAKKKGRSPIIQAAVPRDMHDQILRMLEVVGHHVDGEPWTMSGFLREAVQTYARSSVVHAAYAARDESPPSFGSD